MIKTALLTFALGATMTYSVSDAFNAVRSAALDTINVYSAAAQLDPQDPRTAERLYATADRLQGLANFVMTAEASKTRL